MKYDLIVIGGGTSGIVSAISAKKNGIEKILLIEHEELLGGQLNDIIESDDRFGDDGKTGVELADDLTKMLIENAIEFMVNTRVIAVDKDKSLVAINDKNGIMNFSADALIFATGSKEKPRGILNFTSNRAGGVFSVGTARKFVVKEGYLPGNDIVIYGSDFTGLYLARLLMIEGARSVTIVDQSRELKFPDDMLEEAFRLYGIKTEMASFIKEIKGDERVSSVLIERNSPKENEKYLELKCDCVLLSVGLTSQKQLLKKFRRDQEENGVFTVGNAKIISFDIKEIMDDSEKIGEDAASYIKNLKKL